MLGIIGLFMITLRPKANPLIGRALIALAALAIAALLWHEWGQGTFQPDRVP